MRSTVGHDGKLLVQLLDLLFSLLRLILAGLPTLQNKSLQIQASKNINALNGF